MKQWHRWIALVTLTLMALGPGLFWWPASIKAGTGFSQGWTAVPLPQQLVEAKSKFNSIGFSLIVLALGLIARHRFVLVLSRIHCRKAPIRRQRLYLIYARLQTDGG